MTGFKRDCVPFAGSRGKAPCRAWGNAPIKKGVQDSEGVKNIVKGAVIGASMLVPGLSGGTTAIVLNIYDRLLKAVGNLLDDLKKNLLFLFQVAAGGIVGMLLFSKLILALTERYTEPMMFLFIGIILGSLPPLVRKAALKKENWLSVLWIVPGILMSLSLRFLPQNLCVNTQGISGFLFCVLCGVVIAVALILPGISTSHILLLLGMYERVWQAVGDMDILFLTPILIGCVLGTLTLTRLLSFLLERFRSAAYCLIIGFVVGSITEMLPDIPPQPLLWICLFSFGVGLTSVYFLGRHISE